MVDELNDETCGPPLDQWYEPDENKRDGKAFGSPQWRCDREADGSGLLSRRFRKGPVGSNPTTSSISKRAAVDRQADLHLSWTVVADWRRRATSAL